MLLSLLYCLLCYCCADFSHARLTDQQPDIIPANRQPVGVSFDRLPRLVPFWSKDGKGGFKMINARADGIEKKPAFRTPFKRARCLIPADGFYEWQKITEKDKQPYHISVGEPFAFAGLWDSWTGTEGTMETFTIITTEPNDFMRRLHDRMPVILPRSRYSDWLSPQATTDELLPLLRPYEGKMQAVAVSKTVNNVRNESPECITPL